MGTTERMMITAKVIFACSVVGILYYRVFVPTLLPLVRNDFDGPFTQPVEVLNSVVPTLLLVIVFGFLVWTAVGGLQKERKRDQEIQTRRR